MRKGSALIVEDEYLVALDIRFTLEGLGYLVKGIALSGEEAVELVEKDNPDLIFMDIKLAGSMDGIEACLKIRAVCGSPVVFITGNVDEGSVEKAMEAGAAGFIKKPLMEDELLDILDEVFGKELE